MSISDLPWVLLSRLSRRYQFDGLDIRIAAPASEAARVFDRLVAALRLISQYDPQSSALIRGKLRMLLLSETAGGHYLAGIRTARIGISYAERISSLELAMTIVHEATHAAIEDTGAKYVGRDREQIERRCVEAEIRFAEHVPEHEEAVAKTRALLDTRWWDVERLAAHSSRLLQDRGFPAWLARWIANWTARRQVRE